MKILLISPLPPPEGGIATFTMQHRRYCEQKGIALSIVNTALQGSRLENFNNKRKYLDEIKRANKVFCDLKKKIKGNRPDYVHLNTSCGRHGLIRDVVCFCICKRKKIPVVMHCHCNVEDQLGSRKIFQRLFAWMVKRSYSVITINTYSQNFVAHLIGEQKQDIQLIPNFIDTDDLTPPIEIREDIKNVCFLGHVQFAKGVGEILQTAREFPNINFTFIGPVSKEIEALQRPHNVCFVGKKTHEEAMLWLRRSDVFLFPSYTEGFSIALLEAMSIGLPVIASDVGANRDMIEDKGGIIVPPENANAIADALREINSFEKRKKISKWNIEKVNSTYSMDKVMQQIISVCGLIDNDKK